MTKTKDRCPHGETYLTGSNLDKWTFCKLCKPSKEWEIELGHKISSWNHSQGYSKEDLMADINHVLSQTRNDLLRELKEEMPKNAELIQEALGDDKEWVSGFNTCHDQVNTILERKLSTVKK